MDYDLFMLCRKAKLVGAEKSVLKELSIFMNEGTRQCNPTGDQLAEATGESRASVFRALGALLDEEIISTQENKIRGHRANYVLNVEKITSLTVIPEPLQLRGEKRGKRNSKEVNESHGDTQKDKVESHEETGESHGDNTQSHCDTGESHGEPQRISKEVKKNKEGVKAAQAPVLPDKEKKQTRLERWIEQSLITSALPIPESWTPTKKQAWRDWCSWRERLVIHENPRKAKAWNLDAWKLSKTKFDKAFANHDEQAVVSVIEDAILNEWASFFFDRLPAKGKQTNGYHQQTKSMSSEASSRTDNYAAPRPMTAEEAKGLEDWTEDDDKPY